MREGLSPNFFPLMFAQLSRPFASDLSGESLPEPCLARIYNNTCYRASEVKRRLPLSDSVDIVAGKIAACSAFLIIDRATLCTEYNEFTMATRRVVTFTRKALQGSAQRDPSRPLPSTSLSAALPC